MSARDFADEMISLVACENRLVELEQEAEKMRVMIRGLRARVGMPAPSAPLIPRSRAEEAEACAKLLEERASRAFLPSEPWRDIRRELFIAAAAIRARKTEAT